MKPAGPCVLIILDGWGVDAPGKGNAILRARTPFLDDLQRDYPGTRLLCSGEAVGLPDGIMGNSEVGHLNIGAGRIVYQDLLRIDMAIRDGAFFQNPVFADLLSKIKQNGSSLHLMGLLSDGGVHSQMTHLYALLKLAEKHGVQRVWVHAILDGRDTPPTSGAAYLRRLQETMGRLNVGKIASVCGRYYAMDRDNRWDRIEIAYRLYTRGEGRPHPDPVQAVESAYRQGETDEFVRPIAVTDPAGDAPTTLRDGDGVLFFNFRADRAREITRAFTAENFEPFQREPLPRLCDYVCMTQYDETFTLPIAFLPEHLEDILGQVLSRNGLRQLRIAETEKYAHVTYFFNGGEEKPFPLEDRCLIPSPRDVATYDLKPEMSALAVTDELIKRLHTETYHFVVINFANMDMVGHTGVLAAAVKACETVDGCVERIVKTVRSMSGVAVVTADHGNSEKMIDAGGGAHTAHTLNPVPFILVDDRRRQVGLRSDGRLGDIAPTILEIMGIEKPEQMTGRSLLET
jgi:2,3-bisphosphoglycerate-independent phosphoglycerate mutase